MANLLSLSFEDFSTAADKAGLKATQYSKTGYFVKTANAVRIELQTTRGGVATVGYGSSPKIVEALKAALATYDGLTVEKILSGSVNFVYNTTDLTKFFELSTFVETIDLGAKPKADKPKADKPKAGPVVTNDKVMDKIANKLIKEQKKKVDLPEGVSIAANGQAMLGSEAMTTDEAITIATAKSEQKPLEGVEAIKAANLARLRAVGAKLAKKIDAGEAEVPMVEPELTASEYDELPTFIKNEIDDPRLSAE